MRGGVILIALALVIGYLGVTGRYRCFALFFSCLTDSSLGEGYSIGGGGSGARDPLRQPGAGSPIIIEPGSVGVNESGGQIYDARDPVRFLPNVEFFV